MLFFASGKIEFLVKGVMPGLYGKLLFASGKIEVLVRVPVFGGGKKIEMIFHPEYD